MPRRDVDISEFQAKHGKEELSAQYCGDHTPTCYGYGDVIGIWRHARVDLRIIWENGYRACSLDWAIVGIMVGFIILVSPACAEEQPQVKDKPLALEFATRHLAMKPGHAEVLRYSRNPGTVIIGDDTVVAASIAMSNILVLTGLQTGNTNIIVLGDGGKQFDRIALRVVESGSTVVVGRALEREAFLCNPLCASDTLPSLVSSELTLPN